MCEQLIDASQAKGIVPRAVTRVITPGTVVDEALLESDANVALAAVYVAAREGKSAGAREDAGPRGVSVRKCRRGLFVVVECDAGSIADELARRGVRELIFADMGKGNADELAGLVEDANTAEHCGQQGFLRMRGPRGTFDLKSVGVIAEAVWCKDFGGVWASGMMGLVCLRRGRCCDTWKRRRLRARKRSRKLRALGSRCGAGV